MNQQCIIVTGAASGIGKATTLKLLANGHQVIALDISQNGLAELSTVHNTNSLSTQICDIGDAESITATYEWIFSEHQHPTGLCNIAALQKLGRSDSFELLDWQRIMAVNLTGTFLMCQPLLEHMAKHGGNIVNVASLAGETGIPYDAAYSASKGGVIALTKALAKEYSASRLRVNAVAPGAVDTPMLHLDHPAGIEPEVLATLPRTAQPPSTAAEIAELVVFLATNTLPGMTGSIVRMAGAAG